MMINDLYLPSYDGVYDDEVYCCEYEEGSWAWKDIFYDLSKKSFTYSPLPSAESIFQAKK